MDEADAADNQIEMSLAAAVEAARKQRLGPLAVGQCLTCEIAVGPSIRWCSAACRDDWEKYQGRS